jgi:hypothetical protein
MIRHENGKWVVVSHEGKNLGKKGGYSSEEQAKKRLREVEYFKHKGNK